jgi:hypothetical protein
MESETVLVKLLFALYSIFIHIILISLLICHTDSVILLRVWFLELVIVCCFFNLSNSFHTKTICFSKLSKAPKKCQCFLLPFGLPFLYTWFIGLQPWISRTKYNIRWKSKILNLCSNYLCFTKCRL